MAGVASISLGTYIAIACLITAICMLWSMNNSSSSLSNIRFPDLSFDFTPLVTFMLVSTAITLNGYWQVATSVERKYKAGMKRLAIGVALATSTLIRDEEVYRLDMLIPGGNYNKLTFRGLPERFTYMDPTGPAWKRDSCYKYGTTLMRIGRSRYSGTDIGEMFRIRALSYTAIRQFLNFYESRMVEKRWIYAYFLRYLTYPPGNSKLG